MPYWNPIKNITQTIFQGVVHEQPWYTIVWFVSRVHYCVQMLPGVMFFSSIPFTFSLLKLFSFYGISMVLLLISMEFLWGFPWCFYDISGGFLWDFWRGAMGVLWYSYGISIGFLWDFYGISIGFLWNFYWIPVGFPRYFHDVSMIFLWEYYWNSHGVFFCGSYAIPCYFYDLSMVFLWDSYGIHWYFYDISLGLLLDFYGMSIESKLAVKCNQLKVNSK